MRLEIKKLNKIFIPSPSLNHVQNDKFYTSYFLTQLGNLLFSRIRKFEICRLLSGISNFHNFKNSAKLFHPIIFHLNVII